jgi:hypothetical protein
MARGFLLGAVVAVAAATALVVVLAVGDRDPEPAASSAPRTTSPDRVVVNPLNGVMENCNTRSEADFGPAFTDPANLVVGPLAMIGGASFTDPSTVRRVHGEKYPVLVKAGHRVTIEVPPGAREFTLLGYGPLPQGEITLAVAHERVTFVACAPGEPSGSRAGGPVTFWSGGLVANEPHCVVLDVFVDGERKPRRVFVELGARCPAT